MYFDGNTDAEIFNQWGEIASFDMNTNFFEPIV